MFSSSNYHRVPAEWKRGDKLRLQQQLTFWRACCAHQYCAVVMLIANESIRHAVE